MPNHPPFQARWLAGGVLCLAVLGFLVSAMNAGDAASLWVAAAPVSPVGTAAPTQPSATGVPAPVSPLATAGAPVSPVSPVTSPTSPRLGAAISPLGAPVASSTQPSATLQPLCG